MRSKSLLSISLVTGAICLCPLISLLAEDWPQWRGKNRDGISPEKLSASWPDAGPKTLWRANVGTGFSSVSISRGRAYTMGNKEDKDTIWCLDAATGKELWKHAYGSQLGPQYYEGGPGATPTVTPDRVFTISKWGQVFCLEAASGKIVWQQDLRTQNIQPNRWGFAGSPLLWQDLVILNAGAAGTALEAATGKIAWSTGTNATGYASPVLFKTNGREIVLIFAAKHLVAVDPRTGKEIWRHPWETGWDTNNPDPIPYKDSIFISSYSRGCALLRPKGNKLEVVYESKALHNHLSPGIVLGDYLYAFNGEARRETDFRCLHLPTGELKWQQKSPAFGSLITANGSLIILSEKGELQMGAASPAAFKTVSRAQVLGGLCWTPPSLANGRIYVRNAAGDLLCLACGEPLD
jgi:outer membrane protein assembly factor BamB